MVDEHTPSGDPPDDEKTTIPSSEKQSVGFSASGSMRTPLPKQIGPYKILEVLGEGGMGVVYLAEQSEPVSRRVALKVIKLGMDTKQVVARFESERQALALMDHPNVAQVYAGGTTDEGRPYFVMEHVPGVPITEHCDRQRLNIDQRLDLFMQVCAAVQHAHQKGIIHRDIKPSNILVSVRDGEPIPKVIDFGVAKALHQKLTEKTLFTEQGQLIGTPEYMSPEQAEMTAQDIDTRSDIYSLGVLLYELLTGALPFDKGTLRRAAFGEIQRIIREEEPPKPSTRLSSLGDESKTNARNRRVEPRSLAGSLRGDLDWIVMKALEKDRARRYETANGLAADLKRHLNHEPVLAGPPSAAYKMKKFVRRNRAGVTAAAIVLVVLIGGMAGTTWGLIQASAARDAEAKQRQIAENESANAKAINDFLTDDLLAAVAPSAKAGKGKDVLMRDVLDEASKKIDEESKAGGKFAGRPLIEASIRETLGWTYYNLGKYEVAERHLEQARVLLQREYGEEHPDTLDCMFKLALVYHVLGRVDDALSMLVKVRRIQELVLGDEHPDTLQTASLIGGWYATHLRDYNKAEAILNKVLDIEKRVLAMDDPSTLETMTVLVYVYTKEGRYDDAEPLTIKVYKARRRILGEDDPGTVEALANLALNYSYQHRYEEAEPLLIKCVNTQRRISGELHLRTMLHTQQLIGVYAAQGKYDDAEALHIRLINIKKSVLGPEDPSTLRSMNGLFYDYTAWKQFDKAEPLIREVLDIRKRVYGEKDPSTLAAMNSLGWMYLLQKRYDEAEPLFLEALDGRRRISGSGHRETIRVRSNLIRLYRETLRPDDLRPLFAEQLNVQREAAVRENASANDVNSYAWTLLTCEPADLRDPDAALRLAHQAVDMTKATDANILDTLALAQRLTGDTPGAIETEKKALSLLPADAPGRSDYEAALTKYEAALHSASTPANP